MNDEKTSHLTSLRRLLFWCIILAGAGALVAYLWPVSKDNLITVMGKNGKWGEINTSGRVVNEFERDKRSETELVDGYDISFLNDLVVGPGPWPGPKYEYDDQCMAKKIDDGKIGWIGRDGEWIISPQWRWVTSFDSEGMALVGTEWKPAGWINRKGEMVLEHRWDEAASYRPDANFNAMGLAPVRSEGKWGWINRSGEEVIPPKWDYTWAFNEDGVAPVSLGDKSFLIDRAGAEVVSIPGGILEFDKNDRALLCASPFLLVEINGGDPRYAGEPVRGWIDPKGNKVIELEGEGWALPSYLGLFNSSSFLNVSPLSQTWIPDDYSRDTGYYVAARYHQPSWVSGKLHALAVWLGISNESPRHTAEVRCYHKDGKLIWSSLWMRYETKCLLIFAGALLAASIARPRRLKKASKG